MGTSQRNQRQQKRAEARNHGVRHERLEWLICEEINSIFESELENPLFENLRVTRVELARDGSRARLWWRLQATSDGVAADNLHQIAGALERAAGFVRVRLCEALELKRVPELRFRNDPAAYTESDLDQEGL
jgi:ribosome-binding factor A